MKKLNLEQMEKVQGGRSAASCGRLMGRYERRPNERLARVIMRDCISQ